MSDSRDAALAGCPSGMLVADAVGMGFATGADLRVRERHDFEGSASCSTTEAERSGTHRTMAAPSANPPTIEGCIARRRRPTVARAPTGALGTYEQVTC